jgi:hypothetical protein
MNSIIILHHPMPLINIHPVFHQILQPTLQECLTLFKQQPQPLPSLIIILDFLGCNILHHTHIILIIRVPVPIHFTHGYLQNIQDYFHIVLDQVIIKFYSINQFFKTK